MNITIVGLIFGAVLAVGAESLATHCPSNTVNGTSGEDFLSSPSDRASTMNGFGAADNIRGFDCNDTINSGTGPDNSHGATGADIIKGEDGHENPNYCNTLFTYCGELVGGSQGDRIEGNAGLDLLDDTAGSDIDTGVGGSDNDTIKVNDGDTSDLAQGGTGTDTCNVDSSSEKGSDCEN